MPAYDSIWNGRDSLFEPTERDYAAMGGDGWDLIWVPTSPLTTPWEKAAPFAQPDPDAFVTSEITRRPRRRRAAPPIATDWTRSYTGVPHQIGRGK